MSFIKYYLLDYWNENLHEDSKDLSIAKTGLLIPILITLSTFYLMNLASKNKKQYDLRPIRIVFYAIFFGTFGAGLGIGYSILNGYKIFFQCNPPKLTGLINILKPYFMIIIPILTNFFNFHFIILRLEKRSKLNYLHLAYHLFVNLLMYVVIILDPNEINALALISEIYSLMIYSAMQILDASSTEVRYETLRVRNFFLKTYRISRALISFALILHANYNLSNNCACSPILMKLEYILAGFQLSVLALDIILKNDKFDLPPLPEKKKE